MTELRDADAIVLEELDGHKKGMTEVARNARQTSRTLDALAAEGSDIAKGLVLSSTGHRDVLTPCSIDSRRGVPSPPHRRALRLAGAARIRLAR